MKNTYNLIDEPWIPIRNAGLVSLKQLFSDTEGNYQYLEGSPVRKLSIFKLLLAIVQSARTLEDDEDWIDYDIPTLSKDVLQYLNTHHDKFYLYGSRPFLQMPQMHVAKHIPLRILQHMTSENKSLFRQSETERPLQDFEKAWIVIQESAFGRGGKAIDENAVLSDGYEKKSGQCGPSLGKKGILHSFWLGTTMLESLYYNMLTTENITASEIYQSGLGTAVWEKMPQGEVDAVAEKLKTSYLGRLVPLSRFLLLNEDRVHYSEGIRHLQLKEHFYDLSMTIRTDVKKDSAYDVIWADPDKKPWRNISEFLSFPNSSSHNTQSFFNSQLQYGLKKITKLEEEQNRELTLYLWSSGIKVSNHSGEQYVSQGDDSVDSLLPVNAKMDSKTKHYIDTAIHQYIKKTSETLDKSIHSWYEEIFNINKSDKKANKKIIKKFNKKIDKKITHYVSDYWNSAELLFMKFYKDIITPISQEEEEIEKIMKELHRSTYILLIDIYNKACAHITSRQIIAWTKHHPGNYRKENT